MTPRLHLPRRSPVAMLGVALLSASALLAGCGNGLTAQSSCKDFMAAGIDEQNTAIAQIAVDEHSPDAVTPLGRPNIDYLCAQDGSMTLGRAVALTK